MGCSESGQFSMEVQDGHLTSDQLDTAGSSNRPPSQHEAKPSVPPPSQPTMPPSPAASAEIAESQQAKAERVLGRLKEMYGFPHYCPNCYFVQGKPGRCNNPDKDYHYQETMPVTTQNILNILQSIVRNNEELKNLSN